VTRTPTRERLLTAALELFADREYRSVTAAEIAARAGVTEMTFYRHFPSKDSVLVDDPYDPLIAQAIADQPATMSALDAALHGVLAAWRAVPSPDATAVRERLKIVARTPELRGALARNSAATEAAIAEALQTRGTGPGPSRIIAAATVAALNAALLDWSVSDDGDLGSAIDAAVRALEEPR
jgi:AcrR family transcriptional regulator